VAAKALWLLLALGATASAEPRSDAGLIWRAPAGCPTAAEVSSRIEQRLAGPIEPVIHGIEVEITAGGPRGFVARVDLHGVGGASSVRVLTAASCDELTDAVAVIAVRLAAELRQPVQALAAMKLAAPPPEAMQRWGAGIRLLGNSGIGAQPGVGTGGELGLYGRREAIFADVAVALWRSTSQQLRLSGPARVDVRLRTAALRFGWRSERQLMRAWLTGELGTLRGDGVALGNPIASRVTWGSVGAGFGVAWPMLRQVRLIGVIEVAVPVRSAQFTDDDGMVIYRAEAATARCGLGLEVGWP
jgi:hypothetical protein